MAGPPVNLYLRVRGGPASFAGPVLDAGGVTLTGTIAGRAYMVYPAAEGDLTWQGSVFGLSAPASGALTANVWQAAVTVGHFCSQPASFTSVTAQIYDTNTSAVIASQPFTLSASLVTETITWTGGYAPADVPDLAVRMVWHQTAVGYVTVRHAYAEISWSYSDSIGMLGIDPAAVMPAVTPSVSYPAVSLVAEGPVGSNLSPSFGQPTTAGDLLLAWMLSNSGSGTFDTTCSDPSWQLAGFTGKPGSWVSLWYKPHCGAGETAPVFSSPSGLSLSELVEFRNAGPADQAGGSDTGTGAITLAAASPDTASGNLIFAFAVWGGSNPGPTTLTMTGTDSSATPLALAQNDNRTSTGTLFWGTGWGQAGAPAGPGEDTVTATLGVFAGSLGMVASFKALPAAQSAPAALVPSRPAAARVVTIPVRIGASP